MWLFAVKLNVHVKYPSVSWCRCFLILFSSVKCDENAALSSLFSGTTAHSGYQEDIFDTESTQSGAKTKDLGL